MKIKALILFFTFSLFAAKVAGQCTTSLSTGSVNQTVCVNAAITSIVWTTDATSVTSVAPHGLPAGVTVNLVSGSSLTISGIPTAAGTFNYTVNLSGPGGSCSVSGTLDVTPTVGAPSAPSGTITLCQGSGTTAYTTSATNATSYTWTVTAPNSISGTGTTGTVTWDAGFSGPATISVTSNGCGTSGPVSTVVNVNPPVGAPSAPSGTTTLCQGSGTTAYTTSATNATSYTWTVTAPNSISGTGTTGTVTWDAGFSGPATVSVTSNGCGTSGPVSTVVNVNPTVGAPSAPSGTTTLCQGSGTTAYTTSATNAASYTWTVTAPNSISGTGTTGTVTWDAGFSGPATVSVTSNGCGTSGPVSTVVNVNPTVGAPSAPSGTTTLCQGSGTTAYTTSATNATSYTWTVTAPNSISGTGTTGTVTWDAGFSGIATVSVTAVGCGSSGPVSQTVNITPTVGTPSAPSGTTTICQGSGTTAYTTSATNATSYTWTVTAPNSISGTGTTGTVTWDAGFSGPATVSVTSNGCGTSSLVSTNITVNPLTEDPVFTAGATSFCINPPNTTYTATALNSTSIAYSVDPSGTSSGKAGLIDAVTGVMSWKDSFSGIATITATATGLCGTTVATRVVTIYPSVPSQPGTITGNSPVCQGQTGVSYSISAVANSTNYVWAVPAGATITSGQGTTSITVDFSASATTPLNISVRAENNCGLSTSRTKSVIVSPTPTATISGTTSVCQGAGSPTITFHNPQSGAITITYNINGTGQTTINVAAGPGSTATVTAPTGTAGTFIYTLVSVAYQTGAICSNNITGTATVTVTPTVGTPTAITVSAGGDPACQLTNGSTTTTYATTASNSTSFNWSLSNGAAGSINSSGVMTWANGFSGSVDIRVTANGCGISSQVIRSVTVNSLPVPTLTGPITVRATSTLNSYNTEGGMLNYMWNVSSGGTITSGGSSISNSVTVTWNTPGPQSVSVWYTNNPNGCTAASATVNNITVNPLPSATGVTIIGTAGLDYVLTGDYTYNDIGGTQGISTFKWFRNGTTEIPGANAITYVPVSADLGKTITFEVTPVSTTGIPYTGLPVKSSATVPVEDLSEIPVADQVCIEGVRAAGSIIRGRYRYTHSKPEGASIQKWYIDGIYKASGNTYTLVAADIDNNEEITFEVTPVSSNIIPVTGIPVASDPLAKIPLWPVDYSVAGTSVPLTATPAGGIFSGPGVTNGFFSPNSVGIGGPYNIQYLLLKVNSSITCSQQVTKAVNVVANTTEFNNFKPVYCNDESPSVITVTGVPAGSTSLGFTCTDADAIVSVSGFSVTIDPMKMNQGSNVDFLYFSYRDILFNTYTISKSFVIDKVGTNIQILNLDAEYCTDAPIAAITVTGATPAGGTATWTGAVLSDLTATTATVNASLGIPGQTYPLTYQYTTPLGCKSAILPRSVIINPLPNTSFTLNKFYNYDGPEIDLIPVQGPGTFSGNGVVSNNKLLPLQAGPGQHTINYYIRDDKGCDDSRDITTTIKVAQGTFKLSNGDPFPEDICYRDTTFVINVTGLPDGNTVTSFVNSKNSIIHTPGSASASYNVPAAGEGMDTLTFYYKLDAVDYWISTIVNIDSLGLVDFTNLFPGDKICDNIAPFKLNATPTRGVFYGPVAGNFLDPDTTAGSYGVKYVYTNQDTKCSISKTIPIEIIEAPKVSFVAKDACIVDVGKDSTYFINNTVSSDLVNSWKWEFAEVGKPTSSKKEPGYLYTSGGIHTVKLEVNTLNGCISDTSIAIDLGVRPNADFYWTNDCYSPDENLKLFDATTSDFAILRRTWNFDDGTKISTVLNPEYPMPAAGYVKVQYVVETNYSTCADTLIKYIYLNPTVTLTADNFYFETFESGKGGWEKNDSDIRNSWKYGNPDRSVINSAYSGSNAWFTGYDTVKHLREASSVISQCFDFTNIQRPMIALKTFKRFDKNRNGAALQYKTDDNNSWKLVGTLEDGIDWYNSTLITGEPGGQKVGWTTINVPDEKWMDSRHELDSLAGKKNIKFRIAYGSDGTSQNSEGLAFDDVWIGERSRKVLLEHFTNTGSRSGSEATKIVDDILTRRMSDVINIQYHTNFPDNDLFYTANQGDASARIFSYGLTRVPYSMIDGGNQLMYASLADYKSDQTDLDANDLSRRSLLDTRFSVSVKGTEASGVLTVKDTIISTVSGSFDNLVLYMVVTEKKNSSTETGALGEKTFYNIFRKFIPDAGGIELKKSWTKGEEVVIPDQTWAIPGNLSQSEIEVIAFIQDSRTKEVYQVDSYLMTTAKSGISNSPNEAAAGSEDLSKETATSFGMYPNPADERLTIEFNNRLAADAEVRIFDLQGVIKATYKVASGESGLFIEDLSLKAGIYFVRVTAGGVDLGFKKLIVTGE